MTLTLFRHEDSAILGTALGTLTASIPNEAVDLITKVVVGVVVAFLTGLVHGWAKRFAGRKG